MADPAQDTSPVLAIAGLEVSFKARQVLKGLDLTLKRGEIFGLLGPNGAGKTTLIRAICGRVRPDTGTMAICGEANSHRAVLRRIGLVPQEIALYMHLSARENLTLFGRLSGLSARQTREAIAWAAQAARLEARLDDRVDVFSGGWKRRVNIAAAILHRPALLILDEPTVGVDIDARNELQEVIRALSAQGMAVLLATHDLDQAEILCARVGFLRQGVIAPIGAPHQLIGDTFGARKQIVIELRSALTTPQRDALLKAGFSPAGSDLAWNILGPAGYDVAQLSDRLARAGVAVREIRLREPGLDSLFLHLAQAAPAGVAA